MRLNVLYVLSIRKYNYQILIIPWTINAYIKVMKMYQNNINRKMRQSRATNGGFFHFSCTRYTLSAKSITRETSFPRYWPEKEE